MPCVIGWKNAMIQFSVYLFCLVKKKQVSMAVHHVCRANQPQKLSGFPLPTLKLI